MELRRKFYDNLVAWKQTKRQECLLVKGARQIGKTYIIEKFGREQYESFIEFNFVLNPEACAIFDGDLHVDALMRRISAFDATHRLMPGKTLIFLDEIQECPNARTALKSFAIDGRFDVIASGSLLGIKYRNKREREAHEPKSIAVGYERQMMMFSLDFEEFLWANGVTTEAIDILRDHFNRREMVPEAVNRRYEEAVREYMIVGGMPEVVKEYVSSGNFGPVQDLQMKILTAYIDDIHKYASSSMVPKIENCYRAIPRVLANENRKFKYSEIEKNGSERKFGDSVEWLVDAGLAPKAACVSSPLVPISAFVRDGWFKLYLSDIGLLMALYGLETKRQLYADTLSGAVKGGIYENLISGMLQRNGLPLYYYKTLDGTREIEFVIEGEGGVVPIEAKAHNGTTVSLNELLQRSDVPFGYKLTGGNVGVTGKKITLPHYMAMFL